jgi:hypothetical protein
MDEMVGPEELALELLPAIPAFPSSMKVKLRPADYEECCFPVIAVIRMTDWYV